MDSYKKLIVWQESRKLNKEIYRIVSIFPPSEIYALSDQLKRASVSITSNIAEGYGQGSLKNRLRFLFMAIPPCPFRTARIRANFMTLYTDIFLLSIPILKFILYISGL